MLIYKGWGIMAFMVPIICVLIGIYFFGENGNSSLRGFLYSLLLSGIILVPLGLLLNRNGKKHNLYFIPLAAWGAIWIVVALGFLVFKHLL